MALTCAKFETLIIDYLDGQLDAKQRLEMDRHMKACSACAREVAIQKIWLEERLPVIKSDPERQPSAALNAKIMAAVSLAAQRHQENPLDESEMPGMAVKSDYTDDIDQSPEIHHSEEKKQSVIHSLPWFQRPVFRRAFSTVAALVVVAVGLQVFAHLYRSTFRSGDMAPTEAALSNGEINRDLASLEYAEDLPFDSDSDEIAQDDAGIGILGNETATDEDDGRAGEDREDVPPGHGGGDDSVIEETTVHGLVDDGDGPDMPDDFVLHESDWQVYSGFLANLPVGGSLFRTSEEGNDGSVINVPTTAPDASDEDETDQDGDIRDTSGDAPDETSDEPDLIDPAKTPIDILAESEAIRVLTREGPPQESLLLVFWEEKEAAIAFRELYMMSQNWPYRTALYQMPAQRAQEQLEAELGSSLADEVFTDVKLAGWEIILIRIGE